MGVFLNFSSVCVCVLIILFTAIVKEDSQVTKPWNFPGRVGIRNVPGHGERLGRNEHFEVCENLTEYTTVRRQWRGWARKGLRGVYA